MHYFLYIWMLFLIIPHADVSTKSVHDFHLSKTDVNYKTENEALQVTVHTFIDDTEEALRTIEDLEYKFFETKEHMATDSIFSLYLQENLIIKVDGKEQEFYYLGKEQSDDILGVYTYLEIEGISEFKQIEISNSILMDIFDDQKNIINVKVDNKSKAFHILTKGDSSKQIKL